jgi:hypothetical protein
MIRNMTSASRVELTHIKAGRAWSGGVTRLDFFRPNAAFMLLALFCGRKDRDLVITTK